jgi:hypothetical protein
LCLSLTYFTCCVSGYEQNIAAFAPATFCLDINETKNRNTEIKIGEGSLTLNKDMSFKITNDSLKFSNIIGEWDLCCRGSDWGNYVFKLKNHIKQITSSPKIEIKVDNKIYNLVFTVCE